YKGLKKIINELSAPLTPSLSPSEASKQRLQAVKASFFYQVDRELEKVNSFYLQKEADSKLRLKSLIDKQKSLRSRGPRNRTATIRSLREAFLQSRHELDKLQNFVEINGTGFRKILKKWDKRSKSSTKELYLARQVEVQPCFNQDIVAELSDTVTRCLSELENALDGSGLMAPAALPTQLDLISSPSLHATLNSTSDIVAPQPLPPPMLSSVPEQQLQQQLSISNDRRGSAAFIVDVALSRSVQIDRMEAELFHAISSDSASDAVEILDRYKEQQTSEQKACVTRVLWKACSEFKNQDAHQLLIDSGLADLCSVDDINERTIAHEAAIHGSLAILKAAATAGYSVDEPDYYGRRPIHYASINGHAGCIEYLLEQNCNVEFIDDDGNCAFNYAVINGHVACAKLLLEHGSNAANGTPDHPPLILACEKGRESVVHMLLGAGAEIASNSQGIHPVHVAARAGYASILRLLLDHGAPANVFDKDLGWTAVFYAASEGNLECIRLLLDAGCDLDVVDEVGRGPAYYAANEGHLDCVDLLLESADNQLPSQDDAGAGAIPSTHDNMDADALQAGSSNDASSSGPPATQTIDTTSTAALCIEDTVTDSTTTATGAATEPSNMDLDLDGIPSLALPPPLIPFRIYGHNFLGKRTRIQIRVQARSKTGRPPVSFFDDRDMMSLKLVVVAKPDAGMVPHTVMLPLETPFTTFGFQTDDPSQFRLEFFLYPSFGLQPIGKAVALPSLFTDASKGVARLPLLDRYLKLVAEVSFDFLVVRPFQGAQLQIGGKVETYWKSTNPGPLQSPIGTAGSGQSPRLQTTPSTALGNNLIGSPRSIAESTGGPAYPGIPLVVSSSLASEHVCIQVQVCKDLVPVVSPHKLIDVGSASSINIPVCKLTHAEFKTIFSSAKGKQSSDESMPRCQKPDPATGSAAEWYAYVRDSGFTLQEVLEMLPGRLGLCIQVLYSAHYWEEPRSSSRPNPQGVNMYIDSILKAVYEDSHKRSRNSTVSSAPQQSTGGGSILDRVAADMYSKSSSQRNTIFCSYSPQICIALNWKQPNYAVFLVTTGREPLSRSALLSVPSMPSFNPPAFHLSLKEAVRFATANNLLGVMCNASLLTRVPSLISNIKNNGLFLISFGSFNRDEQTCITQKAYGVDAIMVGGVINYEAEHAEYAI
ncbi:phosphate system positive regulatory protein pho81, partial [Dipsacomyces acuminosporus]